MIEPDFKKFNSIIFIMLQEEFCHKYFLGSARRGKDYEY
jgi:hypothetical protein